MDNFYRAHKDNHSEKYCLAFIKMFELFTASLTNIPPSGEDRNSEDNASPPNELSINHFWDLCDFFEGDEEPKIEEVQTMQHTHNTKSRGSISTTNPSPTIDTSNRESSQRNNVPDKTVAATKTVNKKSSPVNIDDNVELGFSIIDDLKRTQASISLFELAKIAQFRNEIINALLGKMPKIPQQLITSIHVQDFVVDVVAIGQKSRSVTPPFLLTFKIFNNNVHNCMVDSGASSNVMPYSVC